MITIHNSATVTCLIALFLLALTGCDGDEEPSGDTASMGTDAADIHHDSFDETARDGQNDQTTGAGDVATDQDSGGPPRDIGQKQEIETTSSQDLVPSQDLTTPEDLTMPEDLATPEDLANPQDLTTPEDLANPLDLATAQDVTTEPDAGTGDDVTETSQACPPTGTPGFEVGDILTEAAVRDCEGNPASLLELCGENAGMIYHFYGW